MAEFAEIMKHAKRMCNKYCVSCKECPLDNSDCVTHWDGWTVENMLNFERIVMEWAAAHPEPVYPSWCDWLMEQHMNVLGAIPEVFAKKLGIKPIRGEAE